MTSTDIPHRDEPQEAGVPDAAAHAASDEARALAALEALDPPADFPEPDLTENARTVLERRYLIRDEAGALVETPRQLFWRVARTVAR
ncbi:MAG: ribonucleotide reductase N-terminal alpha domain-containing protein, partial [Planctomycetota bacterium]